MEKRKKKSIEENIGRFNREFEVTSKQPDG
jgi:hypothetical protein